MGSKYIHTLQVYSANVNVNSDPKVHFRRNGAAEHFQKPKNRNNLTISKTARDVAVSPFKTQQEYCF